MSLLRLLFDPPIQSFLLHFNLSLLLGSDQPRRQTGRIVQPPAIEDRAVKTKQVSHACRITPSNVIRRYAVTALLDPILHTSYRHVRTRQPEKEQHDSIAA